jgi:hypothetical protein
MTSPQPYSKDIKGFIYYKAMAEQAAKKAHSSAHGVCVTVDYFHGDYKFVIWTLAPKAKGGIVKHELFADVTDQARLDAHVAGFTLNIQEQTK